MSWVQDTILNGSMLAAIPLAVLAGLLSFFTPCSLPLVPGYLSYVAGIAGEEESSVTRGLRGEKPGRRAQVRVLIGATLFVLGFAVVFTSYGAAFGALGSALVLHQNLVLRLAGVLTIALGVLFVLAGRGVTWLGSAGRLRVRPRVGLAGAPLLGATFGIGWTPCIGPALAAVLVLATSSSTAGRGAALSLAYSLGLGIPFLLAALSISRAMRVFGWVRARSTWFTTGGGVMLVLVGLLQVSGIWSMLIARLQVLVASWAAPL